MNKKSSIVAQLTADKSKWTSSLNAAANDGKKFVSDMSRLKGQPGFFSSIQAGAKSVISKYGHLRAATTDLMALAVRSAAAPAMYNDMRDSLNAVTKSAKETEEALEFIASVSEEQKLEFEPLVEAYENMRSLGYSAEQTKSFIREMGNAIEYAGGTSQDLTAVTNALSKITDKADVSAKSLMQMGAALPVLRTIFKEQFGSETLADLDELNLSSEQLFEGLMNGLQGLKTEKGGVLDALSPEYMASMARLRGARVSDGKGLIKDLPERSAKPDDNAAARVAEMQEQAAQKRAEAAEVEFEKAQLLQELQNNLQAAEAKGDKAEIAVLEDKISLMTEAVELAEKMGITQEQASEHIKAQNEAIRTQKEMMAQIEEEKRTSTTRPAAISETAEDIAISEARSSGNEKKAKKMEAARDKRKQTASLIEAGVNPDEAAALANRSAKAKEQEEYFNRTGRRRLTSSGGSRAATGLTSDFGRGGGFATPSQLQSRDPSRDAEDARRNRINSSNQTNDPALRVLEEIRNALINDKRPVADRVN